MNSQTNTLYLVASILAFAILANVSAPVFATGGLDDEEEEEAIENLQNAVEEIKGTLGTIELNLTEGANDIQANCPSTEEIVQEVVENITTAPVEEQPAQCPTVAPPQPEPEPVQNVTEPEPEGCNPVPEEPPVQNETAPVLEPIICPVNGELLGYTNTTSGEQLPISAGNNTTGGETIPILPSIELPVEEEEEQPAQQQCNVVAEQPSSTVVPENNVTAAPIGNEPIEFDVNCGCFAVDKSAEEVQ